jgi:hypothetical protein
MLKSTYLHAALLSVGSLFLLSDAQAVETQFHGLIDIRASSTDSLDSYLNGGYGKFAQNDGEHLSLSQGGAELKLTWDSGLSAHLVANAYIDQEDSAIGFTEAYLKYRSLPNSNGYRWQAKLGAYYPEISLENDAVAWASKHTLNSSSINTWIGEEIRVLGSQFSLTRLGRLTGDVYDLSFAASAFVNNDPAGSMLSWHGWTVSSRQTLWTENLLIPPIRAMMPNYDLAGQARRSDPFKEVDDRIGFHGRAELKLHNKGQLSLGYYDNQGIPYIVENGQYSWRTRFSHIGVKWSLPLGLQLTAQYLHGDTLMQRPDKTDVVNNDYASGYLALSKRIARHRLTMRLEEFSVTDNDIVKGDNNEEYGKAATFNYTYRVSKPWFLSLEYTWINSNRKARIYTWSPIKLTERQLQLAARYFF